MTSNFGVVEVASTRTTSAPGWAYVPDTGPTPQQLALQPAGRKRAAAQRGGLSLSDASARRDAKLRKEIEVLDRDNPRDVNVPIPVTVGRARGGHTANTRKILQSQKTFANHLDDFEAMLALAEQNPSSSAASAAAAAMAALTAAASGVGAGAGTKESTPSQPATPSTPMPTPATSSRRPNALQRKAAASAAAASSGKGKQPAAGGRGSKTTKAAVSEPDADGDTTMADVGDVDEVAAKEDEGVATQDDPWEILFPPSEILAPLLRPPPQTTADPSASAADPGRGPGEGNARQDDPSPAAAATTPATALAAPTPEPRLRPPPPHPGDVDPLLASWVPPLPADADLRLLLAVPPLNYHEARTRFAPYPATGEDDGADRHHHSHQSQRGGGGAGAAGWAAAVVPVGPSTKGVEARYPVRTFCEVCGYWGKIRCIKCGARVCALDCLGVHREECVTRYGL